MTRLASYAAILAGVFASGLWVGSEWQMGRQARAVEAQAAADAAARSTINIAEAARLAETARLGFTLGEVTNETLADPDAGAVSLGLRDAQRLNRIK